MKKWYKKYFFYDELDNLMFSSVIFYAISAVITYFAYYKGIIDTKVNEVGFTIENIIYALMVPFILLFTFMQLVFPAFLGLWIYFQYAKKFSLLDKVNNIIPISNKMKFMNLIKNASICCLLFILITYITNTGISLESTKIFYNLVLFSSTAFSIIIVDIFCRESNLGEVAKLVWSIITMFISISGWNLVYGLLSTLTYVNMIIYLLIASFCILEIIYILKTADKVKIG